MASHLFSKNCFCLFVHLFVAFGVCHLIVRTLFWRIRSDKNVHFRFFVNAKHEALEDSCVFQKMCLVCGPWTCMFLERDEIAKKMHNQCTLRHEWWKTVGERFGHFQDAECHAMKSRFVSIGDGGIGRVPFADIFITSIDDNTLKFDASHLQLQLFFF